MANGWNLWMWLECIGVPVVSGCCCNDVYRYLHNNYNFSLYIPLEVFYLLGGGGAGGKLPQNVNLPPKHFHKIWQNTTEQLSYSWY